MKGITMAKTTLYEIKQWRRKFIPYGNGDMASFEMKVSLDAKMIKQFIDEHSTPPTRGEPSLLETHLIPEMSRQELIDRLLDYEQSIIELKKLIETLEDAVEYKLQLCDKCVQMTNHINNVCQKCKLKQESGTLEIPIGIQPLTEEQIKVWYKKSEYTGVGYPVEMLTDFQRHLFGLPKEIPAEQPKEGKYIMGMDVAKGPDSSSSVLLKKVGGGVFEVQRDLCKSGALLPSNPSITKSPD